MIALLALLLSTPAFAGRTERSEHFAEQAADKLKTGDVQGALKAVDKAIKLDPKNASAHWLRAMACLSVAQIMTGTDTEPKAMALATLEFQATVALAPDSDEGQNAKGMLAKLTAPPVFADPEVDCPPDAVAAFNRAEAAFGQRDMATAKKEYADALTGCPTQPAWQTYAGDADLELGDSAEAKRHYEAALALSPCYWVAHRFLGDVLWKEGQGGPAYDHTVTAVACNPTYDLAWQQLASFAQEARGSYRRVVAEPPQGDPSVVSVSDADLKGPPEALVDKAVAAAPWGAWRKAMTEAKEGSVLDRQRVAVRAGIAAAAPYLATTPVSPSLQPWQLLAEADAAGQLDAAIFLLVQDRDLIAEYPAWRDAHLAEAEAYVRQVLVRMPGQ